MKKHIFSVLFLTILGVMACQKEEINLNDPTNCTTPDEYLIFGQVGLGWGCGVSAMYMISNGNIYADTSNNFCKVRKIYSFSGYQLSDNEYNKVKNLVAQFPIELSKEGTKTFGCPGCADGGILYIQRKEKGKEVQIWQIDDTIFYRDTDVGGYPFPAYLLPYGKAFGKIIPEIKYK